MKKQLLFLIAFVGCFALNAQVIHVPADHATIQSGIDAAGDGDTVLVAQGTYYENIDFIGKKITVASHYLVDPDSSHIFNTIIDGSQPPHPDSASVVYFVSGEDTTSILCGFTIQNGTGTYPVSEREFRGGGGILIGNSGAKLMHNYITNNSLIYSGFNGATCGSGICAFDDLDSLPTIIVKNNLISNNSGLHNGSGNKMVAGVGLTALGMNVILQNNQIINNEAEGHVIGVGFCGGACAGIIMNNHFEGNHLKSTQNNSWGGAIYLEQPEDGFTVTQNMIVNNTCEGEAQNVAGGIGILWAYENRVNIDRNKISGNWANLGAGIFYRECQNLWISNNLIANNTAYSKGGGIFVSNVAPMNTNHAPVSEGEATGVGRSEYMSVLVNNTVVNNNAGIYGGGIATNLAYGEKCLIFNNILYDNSSVSDGAEIYTHQIGDFYLYFNDLDTNKVTGSASWTGEGNFFGDPEFEEETIYPTCSSPCVHTATDFIEIDGLTYNHPDDDYYGNPRPIGPKADVGAAESDCVGITEDRSLSPVLNIKIIPNPVRDEALIELNYTGNRQARVQVFDLNGRLITNLIPLANNSSGLVVPVNVNAFEEGIYLIRVIAGKQDASARMLVVK